MNRLHLIAITVVGLALVALAVNFLVVPWLPGLGGFNQREISQSGRATPTPAADLPGPLAPSRPSTAPGSGATGADNRTPAAQLIGRARRGSTVIRPEPSESSEVITTLFFDTPLPIIDRQPRDGTPQWYKTRIWGVVEGWVKASQVDIGPLPEKVRPFWEGQAPAELNRRPPGEPMPLKATGRTKSSVNLRSAPGADNDLVAELEANVELQIDSWAVGSDSYCWFHVSSGGQSGWVYAGYVDLQLPRRPAQAGAPIWQPISGRGMWLPANFAELVNPRYLVEAAKALKLSHLYVEAGESEGGFFARGTFDSLLPAARAAGIRVIAWITVSLADVPRDVALTAEIANYRTPGGHQVDGVAADLEQNLDVDDVKTYAQVVRLTVGPDRLLVATIYPARSWMGSTYPAHLVLAPVFDAITPMAYWNDEERSYSYQEVYEFARQAVSHMREDVGDPDYPVALIGQMYDTFGRNGIGQHSPTAEEIRAAMQGAKDAGAVGISFFQWGTATPEEWEAFRDFPW